MTVLHLAPDVMGSLPALGLGMSGDGPPMTEREVGLLRALGPMHLRVDLHLDADYWWRELERAQTLAGQLGSSLEVALLSSAPPKDDLSLASRLAGGPPVSRVLALTEGAGVTTTEWLAEVRRVLGDAAGDALIAVGTNANFCELNRSWAQVQGAPAVAYSLNPQVHAFDDWSLLETLPVQGMTVRTAQARAPGSLVVVSPVTLRPRFNPVTAEPEPASGSHDLPPQVDTRQMSLFAAGWTLGSLASLGEAGAASCTFFETAGWRGVLEREVGSPLPDRFPSRPGMVFPAYHVLADAIAAQPARVQPVVVPEDVPPAVAAIALRSAASLWVLVANLRCEEQEIQVDGLPEGQPSLRVLDETTAEMALFDPFAFRSAWRPVRSSDLTIRLAPYSYVAVTVEDAAQPRRPPV